MTRTSEKELYRKAEELARHSMSNEDRQEQRISFAYGNASVENPNVTKELVEEVANEPQDRQILED